MAFLLNKTSIASHFRSHSQKTDGAFSLPRRGFHVELGAREKASSMLLACQRSKFKQFALLADDPALKQFKSEKKTVRQIKRIGDVLTVIVVAGCCYEIYARTVKRDEARKQTGGRQ